jgi:hypothetical protein
MNYSIETSLRAFYISEFIALRAFKRKEGFEIQKSCRIRGLESEFIPEFSNAVLERHLCKWMFCKLAI